MAEQQQKILEIRVNYEQAVDALAKYTKSLDASKAAEKDLRASIKERGYATDEERKRLEASKVVQQDYANKIRETRNAIEQTRKAEIAQEGSVKQLRAELSLATKAYDDLSRSERESAKGRDLVDKIAALRSELKGAEEETGRFQRSVGSYENAIKSAVASSNPFIGSLVSMTSDAGDATGAFGGLSSGAKALGTTLKGLAANPIFLILSVLAGLILGITKAIKSSEEATARVNAILAPVTRALDFVLNLVQKGAGWLLSLAESALKAAEWFGSLLEELPLVGGFIKDVNDANREAVQLEKDKYELSKRTREATVANAKAELDVSTLRSEAMKKDQYTAEERLAMIQKAGKIEEETAARNKALAVERLRIAEAEAARTENTAEIEENLANLRAEVYRAETNYRNKTRELLEKENSFRNEIAADEKARHEEFRKAREEAAKAAEEAAKKEEEAIRQAEDAMFALVKEGAEKRRMQVERETEREIEAIRERLEKEKDLTEGARLALNQTIRALEEKKNQELAALQAEEIKRQEEENAARIQAEADHAAKALQARLKYVQEGSEEELLLKKAALDREREQALAEAANLGVSLDEVNRYYQEQRDALDEAFVEEQEQKKKAAAEREVQIQQEKAQAIGEVMGSIADLAEAIGEENEALAKASKVIALAEIAINQGVAIAKGVAAASSVPFPGNLAAIASVVSTIIATLTTAIKTVKSAKFADGGLVVGAGSGTSDSVPAMLSNGESVNTERSTQMFAPLLSSLNQIGGGAPIIVRSPQQQQIGADMLAEAFARGASMLPNPVVSVQEINTTETRVETLEALTGV